MPSLLTSKKLNIKTLSYDVKNHAANNWNVWENANDPDDENDHFKQPHIAIEK